MIIRQLLLIKTLFLLFTLLLLSTANTFAYTISSSSTTTSHTSSYTTTINGITTNSYILPDISTTTPLTPTVTPTKSPTPTPTKSTQNPTQTVNGVILNEKQVYIMQKVNEYRASQKLPKVNPEKYTCDFAKVRAKEIYTNFSHSGWTQRVNSRTLPYPSYSLVNENIAMTSDYKQVVSLWINSAGHAKNMRSNTPYVCVVDYGKYFAYEGWKP